MLRSVDAAYQQLDDLRPLVRPTYNQFEVKFVPPYGDPEVYLLGELGTYVAAGLFVNAITELLHQE
jgi:hypothetical protein